MLFEARCILDNISIHIIAAAYRADDRRYRSAVEQVAVTAESKFKATVMDTTVRRDSSIDIENIIRLKYIPAIHDA
jgi:hypothetical protein